MDFIEGLPKLEGKTIMLLVADRLTKYAHFLALQHPFIARKETKFILGQVFHLHGMPEHIVSDRNPIFTCNF